MVLDAYDRNHNNDYANVINFYLTGIDRSSVDEIVNGLAHYGVRCDPEAKPGTQASYDNRFTDELVKKISEGIDTLNVLNPRYVTNIGMRVCRQLVDVEGPLPLLEWWLVQIWRGSNPDGPYFIDRELGRVYQTKEEYEADIVKNMNNSFC